MFQGLSKKDLFESLISACLMVVFTYMFTVASFLFFQ